MRIPVRGVFVYEPEQTSVVVQTLASVLRNESFRKALAATLERFLAIAGRSAGVSEGALRLVRLETAIGIENPIVEPRTGAQIPMPAFSSLEGSVLYREPDTVLSALSKVLGIEVSRVVTLIRVCHSCSKVQGVQIIIILYIEIERRGDVRDEDVAKVLNIFYILTAEFIKIILSTALHAHAIALTFTRDEDKALANEVIVNKYIEQVTSSLSKLCKSVPLLQNTRLDTLTGMLRNSEVLSVLRECVRIAQSSVPTRLRALMILIDVIEECSKKYIIVIDHGYSYALDYLSSIKYRSLYAAYSPRELSRLEHVVISTGLSSILVPRRTLIPRDEIELSRLSIDKVFAVNTLLSARSPILVETTRITRITVGARLETWVKPIIGSFVEAYSKCKDFEIPLILLKITPEGLRLVEGDAVERVINELNKSSERIMELVEGYNYLKTAFVDP